MLKSMFSREVLVVFIVTLIGWYFIPPLFDVWQHQYNAAQGILGIAFLWLVVPTLLKNAPRYDLPLVWFAFFWLAKVPTPFNNMVAVFFGIAFMFSVIRLFSFLSSSFDVAPISERYANRKDPDYVFKSIRENEKKSKGKSGNVAHGVNSSQQSPPAGSNSIDFNEFDGTY